MWSDNDIDKAFQRLNPPEPEPAPFPLDAWLRLETQLDKEVVARTVRRKMWRLFAIEVLVVALVGLGWVLWKPAKSAASATSPVLVSGATRSQNQQLSVATTARPKALAQPGATAGASGISTAEPIAANEAGASAATAQSESTLAPARAATPGSQHLSPAHARHSLAVLGATPQLHSTPERRRVETRTSPVPLVGALASADLRKGNRLAEKPEQRTRRSKVSAGSKQLRPWATTVAAASDDQDNALAANSRTRHKAQLKQQGDRLAALEAATLAATAPTDAPAGTNESVPAAADNAELTARPVPLASSTSALPTPLALVATVETKPAAVETEPRFFIGLVGAPDVSTVKFVGVEKPLLNLGLTLEYRFTNRLRVSTGLLRANKEYYARREDYDWTNYPRAQTRSFSWVEGKCTVLDVPLNLRYDAVVRNNARWFGSAGLSSFFMHRENYSYDYLEGGDYKLWELPGLVNANQHLFSVLNLSAGYERSLGRHWRLQAEPYFKLPLGGVGAGKVKLTSAGVFLGVKYGF